MERDLLESYLDQGLSLEQIGAFEGRHPSTVAYWLQKHGLAPKGRTKHAPKGGLDKDRLESLIAAGCSQREIAERFGVSQSTVRYWLGRYGLRTARRHRVRVEDQLPRLTRTCPLHGRAVFYRRSDAGYRCTKCNQAAVSERRRKLKRILVKEAGGKCLICGYSRCPRSMHFHHRDPATKSFSLSGRGYTRSLAELRREARKCDLLCSNCHYEVEEGLTKLG
ncbi:MAG TPA: helix-turn-helix domain-containing protein [Solirubrobacterales bacterium]